MWIILYFILKSMSYILFLLGSRKRYKIKEYAVEEITGYS